MMTTLDKQVLDALTQARVGSQEKLAEVSGVNRATLHRWTKGSSLPNDPNGIFSVAKALGVDPLILWNLDEATYEKATGLIALITRNRSWASGFRGLAYLDGVLFPRTDWPDKDVAKKLERYWQHVEFGHSASSRLNYYQKIVLPSTNWQVWYFAYRHVSGVNRTWQPYGFVVRYPQRVRLLSMSTFAELEILPDTKTVAIETWFGPSPAEFKICTLDTIAVVLADELDRSPAVRFSL